MKKQILTILLGIFLLVSVSALYSGETITFDFSDKTKQINSLNYHVINGSDEWFNISFEDSKVYITSNILLEDGIYKIILDINGQTEYVSIGNGGGSSGGISPNYYKWNCTSWEDCNDGYMNRTCEKIRVYSRAEERNKPLEFIACENYKPSIKVEKIDKDLTEIIKSPEPERKFNWLVYLIYFVICILLFITLITLRRKRKRELKRIKELKRVEKLNGAWFNDE